MKATVARIFHTAFYGNSLSITREAYGEVVVAKGYYMTRHGTVHLYGEKYSAASGREPHFSFDFTHNGRNYRCSYREWLTDGAIRRRALQFVGECIALATGI
jgi:extradiol dioxygenase family protein